MKLDDMLNYTILINVQTTHNFYVYIDPINDSKNLSSPKPKNRFVRFKSEFTLYYYILKA